MKPLLSMKKLLIGLYTSIKRFPVTLILTAAIVALLIGISEAEPFTQNKTRDLLSRITMILALGVPLSLSSKLIFERMKNIGSITQTFIYSLETAVLFLYFRFLLADFSMVSVTRYIALTFALYLCFIFIPYLYRRENFELYVIKLFTRFFVTVIYALVLFAGLAAILFTMNKLLGLPAPGKYYYYIWLAVAGIFAPVYFLAGVPEYEQHQSIREYPKPLKILLLYIVLPIITVYTSILYVYFAKILVTRQWPVGMITHLVLWYSFIGTAVIFLISPLKAESRWAEAFIFWFTKLVLPVMAVMFISIGIRLKAYGITENRYFVILAGLWVCGSILYLNFTGTRRNIVLPVSLALIAVLSVFGPWSSYSVSKFSQNQRLEAILQRNHMLEGSKIVKQSRSISDTDKAEISQILRYFNNSHKLTEVKYLPKNFEFNKMESVFGFPYNGDIYNEYNNRYYSYDIFEPMSMMRQVRRNWQLRIIKK